MKMEEESHLKPSPYGYPAFANPAMFTPSQLLMASQIMAASGLTISNPAFFHPSLIPLPWAANSPPRPPSRSLPSPPASNEPLSPALSSRKINNNNNNIVSSSTNGDALKKRKYKLEDEVAAVSLPSPTSSVSPPSGPDTKDANRDKQFTCGVCNR